MNTYKVTFLNTSGNEDFYTMEATSFLAICAFVSIERGIYPIGIDDVTDSFVDADGTITNTFFKRN